MNAMDSARHEVYFPTAVNDVICEHLLIWDPCHQLALEVCTNVWLKMASFAKISQLDPVNCLPE
jgi:hypothetical protein